MLLFTRLSSLSSCHEELRAQTHNAEMELSFGNANRYDTGKKFVVGVEEHIGL